MLGERRTVLPYSLLVGQDDLKRAQKRGESEFARRIFHACTIAPGFLMYLLTIFSAAQ